MVRRIAISIFLTVIALATSSPGPAPIVIPLKQHIFVNLKTFKSNHTETHNFLVKRRKETLTLTEFSIDDKSIAYYGKVSIGTPSKEFPMMFDTGSSDTWITGWGCKLNDKIEKYIFNPSISDTAVYKGYDTKFEFRSGTVIQAKAYTEKVSLAGFSLPDQDLGVAYHITREIPERPYHGAVGMGYSDHSELDSTGFVEKLVERGIISQAIFGFYFERNSQNHNSQLTIGGFDPEKARMPKYYKVVQEKEWIIELNGIRVDDHYITIRQKAKIDTGTTFIHAPLHTAMYVFAAIPERLVRRLKDNSVIVAFNCHAQFSIKFIFGDVEYPTSNDIIEYSMEHSDFISGHGIKDESLCVGSIYGHDREYGGSHWTIGLAFLKNVYTIFDMENNQIGFSLITTSLGDSTSRASRITVASGNRNSQTSLG